MKFIEIQTRNGDVETVNAYHITKMYVVTYNGDTFTRVCMVMGTMYIDSPLTVSQILHRINS
jgi:hypothetical protein